MGKARIALGVGFVLIVISLIGAGWDHLKSPQEVCANKSVAGIPKNANMVYIDQKEIYLNSAVCIAVRGERYFKAERADIDAAILAVAVIGKAGASTLAARAAGLSWREAQALGVLLNTRGLMELVVLNVGMELGILSPALFSMMVLMALVTTSATSPLLRLCRLDGEPELVDPPYAINAKLEMRN